MCKQQNPYHFINTFCLRVPLYSLNFYKNLFNKKEVGFKELKKIWEDNIIREALFIASPELFEQLQYYFELELNKDNKNERLEQTFLKYIIRLSTRCTPFGLFAGVSTGTFSSSTDLELKPINQFKRITRYDTNYISSLFNHLSKNSIINTQLLFYPNSTLYTIANQHRYIEYKLSNNKRSYSLEGIENNNYLNKVLLEAKKGKTIKQLATLLLEKDISFVEARDFISLLIENQILVSELELNITGKETLTLAIERIEELDNVEETISNLKLLQNHLIAIDEKIGNTADAYQKILNEVQDTGASFDKKYLFQTDLFIKYQSNNLSIKHAYAVKRILPLLNKLTSFEINSNLETFKKAFFNRYETREMPLAKVLDIETGIGYVQNSTISNTVPFLQDITPKNKISTDKNIKWTQIDDIIYQKLLDSKKSNEFSIELIDNDFDKINHDWNNTPDTLSAFVEIVKINKEKHLIINGLGANAGNLIARFANGDQNLSKHLIDISSIEQKMNPNKIIAEIVHLPESRTGNILKRPHIRHYEIPYLAKSTLKESQQISIDDLYISIKNDNIILKSKRLNKEVLPKLTCAHYYESKALPVYHFLCDLQYQNTKKYYGYSWPDFLENDCFLPRISYKNIIISKAKWVLNKSAIDAFMDCYNDDKLLLEKISNWKNGLNVPNYVLLIEGDNTLLINLENITSIKLLLNTVKNNSKCELEEFLFDGDTIVKRGNEQYTNECILTFYNREKLNIAV